MDDAGGVGGGQRVGDRDRDAQRLAEAQSRAAGSGASSVWPGTSSMTMKSTPSADSISWIVTMFGWLRAEAARASLREAGAAVLVADALGGQDLDRDLAAEARVAGAVDLAHPAGAERGEHLVRPELRRGR